MSFKFKQFVLEVFMAIFGAFSIYSFYFAISGKATASSLMDKISLNETSAIAVSMIQIFYLGAQFHSLIGVVSLLGLLVAFSVHSIMKEGA